MVGKSLFFLLTFLNRTNLKNFSPADIKWPYGSEWFSPAAPFFETVLFLFLRSHFLQHYHDYFQHETVKNLFLTFWKIPFHRLCKFSCQPLFRHFCWQILVEALPAVWQWNNFSSIKITTGSILYSDQCPFFFSRYILEVDILEYTLLQFPLHG